ncbi:hypothetical protein QBC44DRAFT_70624 [Cladorrhinum sp. PSN332]|nr:hypothetical protein QBC44DRAFT_70624 [Cladorrhinum sp. PSN332]
MQRPVKFPGGRSKRKKKLCGCCPSSQRRLIAFFFFFFFFFLNPLFRACFQPNLGLDVSSGCRDPNRLISMFCTILDIDHDSNCNPSLFVPCVQPLFFYLCALLLLKPLEKILQIVARAPIYKFFCLRQVAMAWEPERDAAVWEVDEATRRSYVASKVLSGWKHASVALHLNFLLHTPLQYSPPPCHFGVAASRSPTSPTFSPGPCAATPSPRFELATELVLQPPAAAALGSAVGVSACVVHRQHRPAFVRLSLTSDRTSSSS